MPIPAVLAMLGTAAGLTIATLGPAYRYAKGVPVQREANGKALDVALQKASTEGKFRDYIRRLNVKPHGGIRGYYEIRYRTKTAYFVIYENGTIAEKHEKDAEWIRHVSPRELAKFYDDLRASLETTPTYKQKGVRDFFQSEIERQLE